MIKVIFSKCERLKFRCDFWPINYANSWDDDTKQYEKYRKNMPHTNCSRGLAIIASLWKRTIDYKNLLKSLAKPQTLALDLYHYLALCPYASLVVVVPI